MSYNVFLKSTLTHVSSITVAKTGYLRLKALLFLTAPATIFNVIKDLQIELHEKSNLVTQKLV